jgi:hypothetical protein
MTQARIVSAGGRETITPYVVCVLLRRQRVAETAIRARRLTENLRWPALRRFKLRSGDRPRQLRRLEMFRGAWLTNHYRTHVRGESDQFGRGAADDD